MVELISIVKTAAASKYTFRRGGFALQNLLQAPAGLRGGHFILRFYNLAFWIRLYENYFRDGRSEFQNSLYFYDAESYRQRPLLKLTGEPSREKAVLMP